jgi:LmbE family N-acetylglucosaminyl deacetylase
MKVLIFFAHPDDETVFNGGTMALLSRAGAEVEFLAATRGEGGETGNPPLCTLEELGSFRQAELACAVKALGGRRLSFLDYQDPRVGPDDALFSFTEDLEELGARLAAVIRAANADVLVTHGSNGEYGHPAHKTCHQGAHAALASFEAAEKPLLYTFAPTFEGHPYPRLTNADDPADLVLDISPVLDRKTAAKMCHRSQHDLFVRKRSEFVGRALSVEETVIEIESLQRVWDAGNSVQAEFEGMLAPYLWRGPDPG